MATEEKVVPTEVSNVDSDLRERKVRALRSFLLRLVAFTLILYVLFGHIIGLTIMPNNDMRPRIDAGDLLLYYRIEDSIKSNDVVVFDKTFEEDSSTGRFVGRVVGCPGDIVEISDAEGLKINGNVMVETDIYAVTRPYVDSEVTYPLQLKEGEYFILADSRHGGMDSREFGVVSRTEIKGVVITLLRRNRI